MSSEPRDKLKPGQALSQVLATVEPEIRPAFLNHLEKKYKAAADLPMLRELKAYREASRQIAPSNLMPPLRNPT